MLSLDEIRRVQFPLAPLALALFPPAPVTMVF